MLDMGKIEQNIAKQAVRHGQPIPNRILEAPELVPGLQLYLDAFYELDSERSYGFGAGPIPYTIILSYATTYELDAEQTEDLIYFVRRMDAAHLERMAEKNKA